jgi:hypothetical protein
MLTAISTHVKQVGTLVGRERIFDPLLHRLPAAFDVQPAPCN